MLDMKHQNDPLTSERFFIFEQLSTAQTFGGMRARVFINSQDKGQILNQTKWRVFLVNLRLYMLGYPVKKNKLLLYEPDNWSKQFGSFLGLGDKCWY